MRSILLTFTVLGVVACSKAKEPPMVGMTEITSGFVDTGYGATEAPIAVEPVATPTAGRDYDIVEVTNKIQPKAEPPASDETSN